MDSTLSDNDHDEDFDYEDFEAFLDSIPEPDTSPTGLAWRQISDLSTERYIQLRAKETGQSPEEIAELFPTVGRVPVVSLEWAGWDKLAAQALVEQHAEKVAPLQDMLKTMQFYLVTHNVESDEAEHLTNIFTLGILVGMKASELTDGDTP